jgi:hypothetical protein
LGSWQTFLFDPHCKQPRPFVQRLQCLNPITVSTSKRVNTREVIASNEHARDQMASSSVNSYLKTRTVHDVHCHCPVD